MATAIKIYIFSNLRRKKIKESIKLSIKLKANLAVTVFRTGFWARSKLVYFCNSH